MPCTWRIKSSSRRYQKGATRSENLSSFFSRCSSPPRRGPGGPVEVVTHSHSAQWGTLVQTLEQRFRLFKSLSWLTQIVEHTLIEKHVGGGHVAVVARCIRFVLGRWLNSPALQIQCVGGRKAVDRDGQCGCPEQQVSRTTGCGSSPEATAEYLGSPPPPTCWTVHDAIRLGSFTPESLGLWVWEKVSLFAVVYSQATPDVATPPPSSQPGTCTDMSVEKALRGITISDHPLPWHMALGEVTKVWWTYRLLTNMFSYRFRERERERERERDSVWSSGSCMYSYVPVRHGYVHHISQSNY